MQRAAQVGLTAPGPGHSEPQPGPGPNLDFGSIESTLLHRFLNLLCVLGSSQLQSGAVYLLILDAFHEGLIPLSKVRCQGASHRTIVEGGPGGYLILDRLIDVAPNA